MQGDPEPSALSGRPPPTASDPFHGGGEAGAILRSIDWSQRPIGPVAQWPQSLRTALSICLSSRHPICIIWGPERLYFYNDAYTPILGAKHPWALGESYITVWPEIWDSVIRPILEIVEKTGQASWADNLLLVLRRHGYNEECYFAFSFAPTRGEDGSVGGVFTAITETTQQVVGERRLRTLRDLGTRAPQARTAEDACRIGAEVLDANRLDVPFALFYLIDETQRLARLVEHTGLEPGHAAAPPIVSLEGAAENDVWDFREVLRTEQAGVRASLAKRWSDLPGGPWPEPADAAAVLPIARPGDPRPYGFLVCGASPRRPFDADCQSFFALVASQVSTAVANARAYAEERRRAEALAELDRAKTNFFSNVSHEFRTPLTLMLGPLEELIERHGAALPDDAREQLQVAHRNSLRLLKLVNSLLDFSRLEAGRLQASYEPVDLAALTSELASMFRAAIEKAGLALVVACQPATEPAYVDRDMWEKIVFNLLSNAYKFTERGEIVVELKMTAASFVLEVRDTGAGIAHEHQTEVFQRFHRVQSSFARTHEGTGIGLALVAELTRLHGGTVELESRPGVGSTFSVRLPRGHAHLPPERIGTPQQLRPAIERPRAMIEESLRWLPSPGSSGTEPVPAPATGTRRHRVLVADDNADMRDYVQRLLEVHYEVRLVADGRHALELAREWRPHLVLTDVMMPELDGIGLVTALRQDPRTRAVPVVLLSARAGEEARVEGLEIGADDYLTKPFSARELLARVQSHVHLAELRQEAEAQVTATEARFEQLVAMMPAGVIACAADGQIVYFNRRAAEIWGAEPKPGDSYAAFAAEFKVLRPDGTPMPASERQMALALREGRAFENQEGLMERPDGTRFLASFNVRPTYDRTGRLNGVINVFQDVTAERAARAALRETEERYRAVFQQASVGIFECELNGAIVRTNPALSEIVGFTAEELQQKNWRDLIHPAELAADEALVARLFSRAAESIRAERRYRRKDGTFGWVDVFATLIRNAAGEPTYGLAVVVDISERKQTEEAVRKSEEQLRLVTDHASVLIAQVDREHRYRFVNRTYAERFGREPQELVGRHVAEMVGPEVHEAARERIERTLAGHRVEFEIQMPMPAVGLRWVHVVYVPERSADGTVVGYVAVLADITARKQAERELERARDEALAASRAKDDFLAALSHELRTPLSPVLLLASEAAEDATLPDRVREDFGTIRKSVELEARLIDDLLDLTRITRDKLVLDRQDVDLATVVRDAFATVRAEFQARKIDVTLSLGHEPLRVSGDPVRLQQVFWNILKNAVKFTPEGGRVRVTHRVDRERGMLVIEVSDTGIGITPQELARVFEAFSQGDHAAPGGSHRFGGLGLGLAISRRVVELHGGRVEAESAGRDHGATFRVELPLPPTVPVPVRPVLEKTTDELPGRRLAADAGATPRILLVEDHAPTRAALERLLTRRNFTVRSAASAAEAREVATREAFDYMISDIGLPDGSGYELMSEFHRLYGLKGIALSGYGMEEDVARSQEAGFVVHLTKPVRMQSLERALAALAGQNPSP